MAISASPVSGSPAESFDLNVSKGKVVGIKGVNKFGRSTNVDSGVDTDIWDGANASDTLATWTPPSSAVIHGISSSTGSDTSTGGGTGAMTVKISGLTAWDVPEQSEEISLAGTASVLTNNAYVIIHRMQVLTNGGTSINNGLLRAIGSTGNVTAQIIPGQGQTQMAIYGIPAGKHFHVSQYYASVNRSSPATVSVDSRLCVNVHPDTQLVGYNVKHTLGLNTAGSSHLDHRFKPYFTVTGPAIIKLQGTGSANDADVSAGFDGYLETV